MGGYLGYCFDGPLDDVRVYNTALTEAEILQLMIIPKSSEPSPADGETGVCRNVVLSWDAAPGALERDVYFGTAFDDVNDATPTVDPYKVFKVRQTETSYEVSDLGIGTTYYWRIDEVNAAPIKGDIWQFTTVPYAYQLSGDKITATASSSYSAGEGPENTINGSGMVDDLHSYDIPTDMWLSGDESPGGAWIQYEFDKVYKLIEMWVWNYNGLRESKFGFKDVTIEYSTDGSNWTPLAGVPQFAQAPEDLDYAHNTTVNFSVVAKYVRITAVSNWQRRVNDPDNYGLSEVRFYYIPMVAREESPESGTAINSLDVLLSWRGGREAAVHNVYISTNEQAVIGETIDPCTITTADGCRASYGPLSLDLGQTYYWKVNEVNMAEEPNTWEGDVWNFTIPGYFVVDDMEDYNDRTAIITVWRDGYTGTPVGNSGANVTVSTESDNLDPRLTGDGPPWPVRDSEAMQFAYDNDGSIFLHVPGWLPYPYSADANYYSEAKAGVANLPIGRTNWTEGGVRALALWFYGDTDNDIEPMWVKLTDQGGSSGKVTYGDYGEDPNDVNDPSWHEWNIGMSGFGVDLTNVNDISIGFGDENNRTIPGGEGVVFFDDIRLYPTKCLLSLRSPDFARVDYVEDCVVDYKEVEVMAENWLVELVAPGTGNLVGHWKLDGNANDSSAQNNHGTINGDPQWVAGKKGSDALDFDGTDDYVGCGNDPSLQITGTEITVVAWVIKGPISSGWHIIAGKSTDENWADGYGLFWYQNEVGFYVGSWGPGGPVKQSFPTDGQWHHVAGTYDGSNVKIWVDGVEGTTPVSYTGSVNGSGGSFEIGRMGGWPAYCFSGTLDDVRVYNAVLTESDIQGLVGLRPDTNEDLKVNFKDFAELAAWFLEDQLIQ
ncbi:MAG: hypothetical protein FVQ85_11615 [Planctomycetes bacterium]|nr:hypothetical protein [Planctomycetota bacterium]